MRCSVATCVLVAVSLPAPVLCAQEGVYRSEVWVQGATRLDWVYPLARQSPAEVPGELARGYRSEGQTYELFEPAGVGGDVSPLVIFVSPQDRPVGWSYWEPTCRRHGVLFAGLREMGNGQRFEQRVRAVLEVLDDLRRRFRIDPDRTYLAGFSGGAHVAWRTAFGVPEYFGGVVCIGDSPEPPEEPWLLERVRRRLSVAIVCGEREPAARLVEKLTGPLWKGAGVRVEQAILRRRGHTMPEAKVLESAFCWLEEDLEGRRTIAAQHPAWRIADAPSRDAWATRQLEDAKAQLDGKARPDDVDNALQQLEGLAGRWPDLPAAREAKAILNEYDGREDRPWEAIRFAAKAKRDRLQAEGYTRLALEGGKGGESQRVQFAKAAIFQWQWLQQARDGAEPDADIDQQIAKLERIIAEAPPDAGLIPLNQLRFRMHGDVTLAHGIDDLRAALAPLGYELRMDEAAIRAAGADLDKLCHPRMKAASLDDIEEQFLGRAGLRARRRGNVIEVVPSARN